MIYLSRKGATKCVAIFRAKILVEEIRSGIRTLTFHFLFLIPTSAFTLILGQLVLQIFYKLHLYFNFLTGKIKVVFCSLSK